MATIVTEQAPSAKPVSVFRTLPTTFGDSDASLITVDDYDVPVIGFGGERRIAPGVAEISSPLVLGNTTTSAVSVTVRLRKGGINFDVANDVLIEPNDVLYVPLNGQFLLSDTDDGLLAIASDPASVTAVISFTQGQAEEDDPFAGGI